MARPTHVALQSGLEAWDGEANDNFDLLFSTPAPIAIYASFATLPTASSYDDCIAVIQDLDLICVSDGTNWKIIGTQCVSVTSVTAGPTVTDPANSPGTADILRDDLVANAISELRVIAAAHATAINAIITAMKATKLMA